MITPTNIRLSKDKKKLTITFDEIEYSMSSEFLRVYSPSAEVQGHGLGQEILQLNKRNVEIEKLKPTGNYAIAIHYSDSHSTGIYSWNYLYHLAINHDQLWSDYCQKVNDNKIIITTRLSYKSFDNFNNHIEKFNLSYCMLV